ncbi:MAG: hypothetical protein AAF614_31745 [Chloroflexota bacterium]
MSNKSNDLPQGAGLRFGKQTKPQTNFRLGVGTNLHAGTVTMYKVHDESHELVEYPDFYAAANACYSSYEHLCRIGQIYGPFYGSYACTVV